MTDPGAGHEDGGLEQARALFRSSPYGQLLGFELVALGGEGLTARVPWDPSLVGNPETGHIHGGVVTALVDQGCGAAALYAAGPDEHVVTLDLRLDHLRPPQPGRDIHAHCVCYHLARSVAFARAVVYDDDPEAPFVTSMSSFMRLAEGGGHG